MRATGVAFLGSLLLTAPAFALETPPASRQDQNMRVVLYDPLQRVSIVGTIGRATNITYRHKERITRVVFGVEGLWEGPAPDDLKGGLKNNLPLWPRKAGQTNLVVTTEDDKGDEHVYQYVLLGREAQEGDDPQAVYGLVHVYPAQERAEKTEKAQAAWQTQRVTWRAAHTEKIEAQARAKLAEDRAAAPKNFRYTGWGDVAIAPAVNPANGCQVCDDGQSTYLYYPGGKSVPAAFILAPDGTEQTLMTSMDGQSLVVHRVTQEMHLRLGGSVLYVLNQAYNSVGINPATGTQADPETGTSSPHVVRSLRRASLP